MMFTRKTQVRGVLESYSGPVIKRAAICVRGAPVLAEKITKNQLRQRQQHGLEGLLWILIHIGY